MIKEIVRWTLTVYLMIGYVSCLPSAIFRDADRYEGNPCQLANGGGSGTCRKLSECKHQVVAIREQRYNVNDRCSFVGDIEIVCCGGSIGSRTNENNDTEQHPADIACAEDGNEVSPTEASRIGFYILGGVNAKQGELPFMAALGYNTSGPNAEPSVGLHYTCGGTLISRKHVLTAAHCVSNVDNRVPVQVRFGSTELSNSGKEQDMDVDFVTPHHQYKRSANYHDIALITLKNEVQITSSVRPACLLTQRKTRLNPAENETLVVAGWGYTSIDFMQTTKLQKAAGLNFVDKSTCDKFYESDRATRMRHGIDDNMICAIDPNNTRRADTCMGDSGGPLLLLSGSTYKLAGITSFGKACGSIVPSVYMSVFSYIDWIEQYVWPKNRTNQ